MYGAGAQMNLATFFERQLAATAEGFVWATGQVPPARRQTQPPDPAWLGTWHVPRHVFHMLWYEREIALPSMRQWLGSPLPRLAGPHAEDEAWVEECEGVPLESLIARFQEGRQAQIALLPRFHDDDWSITRETIWDTQSLQWVVSKTFQHSAEHTHDVMRLALFWDRALTRQQRTARDDSDM